MRVDIQLNFRGNCEEAFRYYEKHLPGKIATLVRHSAGPNPNLPPGWADKVMHAHLDLPNAAVLGADIPNAEPMRSAYVGLTVDSTSEAERLFKVLGDGGQIFISLAPTEFAERFAMLRDRFGTLWMLVGGQRPGTQSA